MIALMLAVALSQAPDAPLANPDAHGKAVVLQPGESFTNTSTAVFLGPQGQPVTLPSKAVCADEQEGTSRERDRVEAHAGKDFWRKVAIGSITGGAVLLVTAVVLGAVVAEHKP